MAAYKDEKRRTWFFEIKVKNEEGNYKKVKRRGFATKKEALEAEAEFKRSYKINSKITLNDIFKKYDQAAVLKNKKSTVETERYRYNNHVRETLGTSIFLEIKSKDVLEWQHELVEKGYKNSFINTLLSMLVTIFNYADKMFDLHNNAIKKVDKLKVSKLDKIGDFWSVSEFEQFCNCIDQLKYKTLFYTLFFTGMRRGELLGLQWRDYKNGYLDINKNFTRYGIGRPKTENSIRKVKLNQLNIKLLDEYKNSLTNIDGFNDDYFIFGGVRPMGLNTLTKAKNKYVELSGVKQIRIHDFRHSHVTFLINNNIPLPLISARVGDSIDTLLGTYAHVFHDDMNEVTELIDKTCGGILG